MVQPSPRPRILFESVPEELRDDLARFAQTADFVEPTDEVHDSDWDLYVSFGGEPNRAIPFRLSFGAQSLRLPGRGRADRASTLARDVSVDEYKTLAMRTVTPLLNKPGEPNWYWLWTEGDLLTPVKAGIRDIATISEIEVRPIVTLGAERLVHAFVARNTGSSWCVWSLPRQTAQPAAWLRVVIEDLQKVAPEKFPGEPDWMEGAEWATPPLQQLLDAREAELLRHQAEDARHESEMSRIEAEAAAIRASAAKGEWRLLTAQGKELEDAVARALRTLGFEVESMDPPQSTTTNPNLEDLRVRTHDDAGWECLVEVKGYTKGAKVSDVPQIIGRPVRRYISQNQREPSSLWHVVNTYANQNPSSRDPAFDNPEVDLGVLAENGGVAIDTRDLFRAVRDVAAGHVTAESVRQSLVAASMLWAWDPDASA
jgi:hypothetical protein